MHPLNPDSTLLIENLGKKFCRNLKRNLFYGSLDVAKTLLGIRFDAARLRRDEFWALEDINLNVRRGESIGIIGANGAGKSTLLRLISGILSPDKGRITVRGRVGTLIALGAGFHPHFSGRENIFLNGAILGMTTRELEERYDEIVRFADIGEFIEAPVSAYSSGMRVRLGFAIAIHSSPDLLVVDEVLAVGDANFMKKSCERMERMIRDDGVTALVVSHNLGTIQRLCARTLTLQKGTMAFFGDTAEAVSRYYESALGEKPFYRPNTGGKKLTHHQDCRLTLYAEDFEVLDESGRSTDSACTGSGITFVVRVRNSLPEPVKVPNVYILILNSQLTDLHTVFRLDRALAADPERTVGKSTTLACQVPCWCLAPGDYRIIVKVGSEEEGVYDSALVEAPLQVKWSKDLVRNSSVSYKDFTCFMPARWEFRD